MTRKPVLGWSEPRGLDDTQQTKVGPFIATVYQFCNKWTGFIVGCDFSVRDLDSADAAKLACEDHLATLLEPLAKTYDILRKNKK